jgi:hypothetical protein
VRERGHFHLHALRDTQSSTFLSSKNFSTINIEEIDNIERYVLVNLYLVCQIRSTISQNLFEITSLLVTQLIK